MLSRRNYISLPVHLFVKIGTNADPPALIIVYVDDGSTIGTPDLIKTVRKALAKELQIKDLGPIKYFVGCQILINRERDTIWINHSFPNSEFGNDF
jgi:hypothetical protein